MYRRSIRWSEVSIRRVSWLALLGASFGLAGCAVSADPNEETGQTKQACKKPPVTDDAGADALVDSCGYEVKSLYHSRWRRDGFFGVIELKNVSGDKATDFEVFADLHGAAPGKCLLSDCEAVEGGYMFTPPHWFKHIKLAQGQTYPLAYMSRDAYTEVTPYVISINGVVCDQVPPTVSLDASGSFYTSAGTLTLTASAADNVAVKKVEFLRDGQVIATDTAAPYTFDVAIAAVENGRHRYTAVAYDISGNKATSGVKSVLTGIGNKFFGTAVTTAADYNGLLAHFNQVTPGNAGKWGSVEAVQDRMNFDELDKAYTFAKANNMPFKLHTLVWGQQQPAWIDGLSPDQQLVQIEQWMAALAERYPNADLIDVVNEPLHAPPNYRAALGGDGATGWDWVIKAFEMARAHFPNAELILNDYSILTTASATQSYLTIINLLKERGLIDGIGEQGHFYERAPEMSVLTANLNALTATGLPVYISELDVDFADDARQAIRMKELFTAFWSNPSVLGVTHWGYLQGNMWRTNAYLVKTDGSPRPALTWIECYKAGGTNCTVPEWVPQPRVGDLSGITLEAEDYDTAHALLPAGNMIAYASDGSWFDYKRVTFNDNWDSLNVTYAQGGSNAISLSIHLGTLDSAPIASVPLAPTGGWNTMKTVSIPWAPMAGERDIIVRFNGGGANVDKLQFAAPAGTGKNLIADSDFEQGSNGNWWSWGSGTIANTTARAASGTHSLAMTGRGSSPLVQSLTSSVLPGKTYKVSLLATVGGAASTAGVSTAIQCTGGSTSYGRLGGWGNSKTLTDGVWTEFAGDLVIPDCALADVKIYLEGPAAGVDMYIDHASVRQVTASNIINNGTFESGTSGWYTWNSGAMSASTARAHGGTQSLLVTNRGSNAPAATSLASVVKPGNNYPYSLYASIQSADGSSKSLNVTQATGCKNADGTVSTTYNWIGNVSNVPSGATWTKIAGTVAVPNCNLASLQIYVEGAAGADLYIDDVQVIDNGVVANLIPDGTFESGQGAWGGWGATISVVSGTAHSGSASLRGAGMASGAISRDIKPFVSPGKRYTATAWVSVANVAAGSILVKWQTVQGCNGTADTYPWLAGATVSNGTWAKVTGTVDLSACTTVEKLLLFTGADSGDVYIDDVELTAVP